MAAYNEIDGIPCHANRKLLTGILREEMGFDGIIMSDGVAIDQLDIMTGDRVLSGALALKAGVDVGLWDTGFARLGEAFERGLVTMEEIDQAVLRVLTMKFERGLFDHPYLEEKDICAQYDYKNYPEALQLARESVVLLKNEDQILPLQTQKLRSIAVIGPNANEIYNQLGDYTPPVKGITGSTVLNGIKDYIKENNAPLEIKYCSGCGIFDGSEEGIREAAELAGSSDVTILVLGGSSSRFGKVEFDVNGAAIAGGTVTMDCGEGVDSAVLELPEIQRKLARAVYAANNKLVTVLIQGRPYAVKEIAEQSKALLCSFYPGMTGGQAIAELLFGKFSPSGRLPVSIPRHAGQLPVYYNHKNSYQAMNYYDLEKQPLYPFGFGLTYTEFQYEHINLSHTEISKKELTDTEIKLSFEITNTGDMDSYAVPQLYLRDLQASTIRRVRELKGFAKIRVSKGETVRGNLSLDLDKLSIWDHEMKFKAEPGEFEVILSDCGRDIWAGCFLLL
jgi:beta-glucosidase